MSCPTSPDVVSPPNFICAWQLAESLDQVAKELGMTKAACRTRAHRYRSLGVPLKELKAPPLLVWNWTYLAQYAEDVLEGWDQDQTEDQDHTENSPRALLTRDPAEGVSEINLTNPNPGD